MPQQAQKSQDELDAEAAAVAGEQTIDWEVEDNPYKKRYTDSQGQVAPLVNTLKNFAEYDHNTKTWKPKGQQSQQNVQTDDDVEKILEGYDPDFRKSLKVYTQKQIDTAIRSYSEQSSQMANYNSGVTESRKKVLEEFGGEYEYATKDGKFNPVSPLYKLADEILNSKYVQRNSDGTFYRYTSPDAEYMATVEAYAIIQRRSKQDPNFGKTKLGAIQGKGSVVSNGKKVISFEDYDKLTDEQKDEYDSQQMGDK